MKKIYLLGLIVLVGLLSAYLSSDGGLSELIHLENQIQKQKSQLDQQLNLNQGLEKQIVVLQNRPESLETIARNQLGLVKSDEIFVEVIDYRNQKAGHDANFPMPDPELNHSQGDSGSISN